MPTPNKPGTLLGRMGLLLLTGILAGVLVNALRPDGGAPWVYAWDQYVESRAREEGVALVTVEQVQDYLVSGDALILDARSLHEYDAGHLPGALSMPMRSAEESFQEIQFFLLPDQPIVTYCSGPACDDALLLTLFLRDNGFTNVVLFPGGMEEWARHERSAEGVP